MLKLSSRTVFDLVAQATDAVERKLGGAADREGAAPPPRSAGTAGGTPGAPAAPPRPELLEPAWTSCSGVGEPRFDRYVFPNYQDPSRE
ncbi:MAG: hypothetical protein WDN30_10920 [Pararobbsia sp.]